MNKCFACKKTIWPWQRTGFNSTWHKKCTEVWDKGYEKAYEFCTRENYLHGLPTPTQLYNRRGSIGEMLPENEWRGDQRISKGY